MGGVDRNLQRLHNFLEHYENIQDKLKWALSVDGSTYEQVQIFMECTCWTLRQSRAAKFVLLIYAGHTQGQAAEEAGYSINPKNGDTEDERARQIGCRALHHNETVRRYMKFFLRRLNK